MKVPWPVGLKVTDVRMMTDKELFDEGWEVSAYDFPVAIIFEDGSVIYASQDEEGNGPGVIFGKTSKGQAIIISPITQEMLSEAEYD